MTDLFQPYRKLTEQKYANYSHYPTFVTFDLMLYFQDMIPVGCLTLTSMSLVMLHEGQVDSEFTLVQSLGDAAKVCRRSELARRSHKNTHGRLLAWPFQSLLTS
jgi:hypothetical protein